MITEINFPPETQIFGKESGSFYRDSFNVRVTRNDLSAIEVYHAIFGFLPKPVQFALSIRDTVMQWFGFSASNTEKALPLANIKSGAKAGFLLIEAAHESEVVCSASERNMDMWLSVLKLSEREFAISTLVNMKTTSGKVYMFCIKPLHKLVAKYSIKHAFKEGRL